jgi:hypothetical protein
MRRRLYLNIRAVRYIIMAVAFAAFIANMAVRYFLYFSR